MVRVFTFLSSGPGLSLFQGHCVVFLSQILTVFRKTMNTRENFWNVYFSQPIGCKMKPQRIIAKAQHWLVTTWHETTSWLFLIQEVFNFITFKYGDFSFSILALVSPKNRYKWHFTEKRCEIKKTGSVDQTQLDNVSESEKKWANHKQFPLCLFQMRFKVAEHSFQVSMPNSPLLLNYLCFGAHVLQESRLITEVFILALWLGCVLLPWQQGWLKTSLK